MKLRAVLADYVLRYCHDLMQWMSKVVGPSDFSWHSAEWQGMFRRLTALGCLFCFLVAVISISDHSFSSRRSPDNQNCKILKGCLDSEDESHKDPVPLASAATPAPTAPTLEVVALAAPLEVFALKSFSLPAEQGRAPPVSTILNF